MSDRGEQLARLTAKILAEGSAAGRQAADRAEGRRQAALRRAEDEVLGEAWRYIQGETARIRGEAGRSISLRMQENRRALALRRQEIARQTLALAEARVAAFTRTPAYGRRLGELLTQALGLLPGAGEVQVYLRKEDGRWMDYLARGCGGRKLDFRRGAFPMGGLVALSPSLGLRVDATFDSAARELSGRFAELFGLSLSDACEEGG